MILDISCRTSAPLLFCGLKSQRPMDKCAWEPTISLRKTISCICPFDLILSFYSSLAVDLTQGTDLIAVRDQSHLIHRQMTRTNYIDRMSFCYMDAPERKVGFQGGQLQLFRMISGIWATSMCVCTHCISMLQMQTKFVTCENRLSCSGLICRQFTIKDQMRDCHVYSEPPHLD